MAKRSIRVTAIILGIIAIGVTYALVIHNANFAIPCYVRLFTGLKCPFCGASRFCLYLMNFDFISAFWSNIALFVLSPILIFTLGNYIYRYIRYAVLHPQKWHFAVMYISIGLFFLFGILRNFLPIDGAFV